MRAGPACGRITAAVLVSSLCFSACGSEDSTRGAKKDDAGTGDGSVSTGGSGGAAGSSGAAGGGTSGEGGLGGSGAASGSGGSAGAGASGGQGGGAPDGSAGSGGSGGGTGDGGTVTCLDPSTFTWSTLDFVVGPTAPTATESAVGLDGQGRAFALLQTRVGSSLQMQRATYDPSTGWTMPVNMSGSPVATSWAPLVLTNSSGDTLAVQRDVGTFASWGQFDTQGTTGLPGVGLTMGSPFTGGFALNEQGKTLVSYSFIETTVRKGYVSVDYADPGTLLFDADPSNAQSGSVGLDANGDGVAFGTGADGTTFVARPFVGGTFGPEEPVHDSAFSVTSGAYGASLGGGTMVAAFGSFQPPAARVQLFATYRDASGTWTAPQRFDTGDDSVHAQLFAVESRGPGSAVAFWQQPDGHYVGRFEGSATVSDVQFVGQVLSSARALSVAPCGNAVFASAVSGGDVSVHYYQAGVGWLPEMTVTTAPQSAGDVAITIGARGDLMLIVVENDGFKYATFAP